MPRLNEKATTNAEYNTRRHLTVLFSDLTNSTKLSSELDNEQYIQLLANFREICRAVIAKHGGRIARVQGDGLLAVFGYPIKRDDDGQIALNAAIALHTEVKKLSYKNAAELSVHSGIHLGEMYVAQGDLETGRFDLLGQVPNLASKLSQSAKSDEILISQFAFANTVQGLKHQLPVFESFSFGNETALSAFRLNASEHSVAVVQSPSNSFRSPYVGRQRELASLLDFYSGQYLSESRVTAIVGDAGIGKSRLLDEYLDNSSLQNVLKLRGYCEVFSGAEPLQPFLQMFKEHAMLGEPGAKPSSESIVEFFRFKLKEIPIVLAIEDWHWVDDASHQLLVSLLEQQLPIAIVLTARQQQLNIKMADSWKVITLNRLDDHAAALLLKHYAPLASPFVRNDILATANGNPLFVEELCRSVKRVAEKDESDAHSHYSTWFDHLIELRVANLPSIVAQAARIASVVGMEFSIWLLQKLLKIDDLSQVLTTLVQEDFILPPGASGSLRFKHSLTRDAVYATIGEHQRHAIHLKVVAALTHNRPNKNETVPLEVLSYHYGAGGMLDLAAEYAEQAGDQALAMFSLDRARVQYLSAITALDAQRDSEQMERRCLVGHKLGMACVYDPISLTDGPAVFERSLVIARQTKNDSIIGRSAYWLGYICYAGGTPNKALVHLQEASDAALRCNDTKLIAQINATLGQTYLSICNYDRALLLLEGAVDSKKKTARPGSGIAVGSAYSLGCKGGLLADQGLFEQAQACFDESLLLLGDSKHQVASSVLNWVGLAYLWQGRWEDALAIGERSVTIAGNIRSTQLYSFSRSLKAYSLWLLNRNERDLNELRVSVQWIAERKGTLLSSMIYGWLVAAAVQVGETREARAYGAKILQRSRVDDRIGEAMGCRSLALLAARKYENVAVNRYLHYAERSAAIRGSEHEAAQNLFCRAQCEALMGSCEAAANLRNQALVRFEQLGMARDASHARGFNVNAY